MHTIEPTTRRREQLNLALAIAFAVAVSVITPNIEETDAALGVGGYALIVLAAATIATRWRWPLPSFAAATGVLMLYTGFDYVGGPVYTAPLFSLYAVASVLDRRRSLLAAVTSAGVLVGVGLLFSDDWEWGHLFFASWWVGVVFVADAARNRRAYLEGLHERARRMEETREEEARRRVAEERLRIARDLHDVVAHSIASINVQSGVAAHVIDEHPDQAKVALLAIKQASREALDELRATLGLLRQGDDVAPRVPAPSLAHLDSLVATASRSGVTVDVEITGDRSTAVNPAVDAAAFRIVQESLTNVVRHAGPVAARVAVAYSPAGVEIDVVDNGPGPAPTVTTNGTGHGLAGMRERAETVGGDLEAGPRPGGGFRVHARLPYAPVPA